MSLNDSDSCDSSQSSSSSSDDDSSSSQSSTNSKLSNNDEDSNQCKSCSSKNDSSDDSSDDSCQSSSSSSSSGSSSSSSNDGSSDSESSSSDDHDEEEEDENDDDDDDESPADEEGEDDYDEASSSDSSRSSNSSSNKFRYSNVVIDKTNLKRDAESLKHSDDNLFTSLSKSPHSLPKISFMSGISDNGKSLRGLPNRHATVPAPDTRPIPNKTHLFNQKESNSFSLLSSSLKKPKFRTRVKREDMLDIPITELDRDILMAIGKIKRQKQRPSVDRLYNICCKLKKSEFDSKEKIEAILEDMINRSLLARVHNPDKGFISYRELNSAIPIVAINNPLKSRLHLIEKSHPENNSNLIQNIRASKCTSPTFPKSSSSSNLLKAKTESPTKMKTVSTSTMTNSIDESIERVVRKFCKESNNKHSVIIKSAERLRCGMCGKSDKNELITCSVCGMSGHSTCLGCSETLLKRIKEFPNWECPNCKKCPVCGEHDDETNIICVVCDRAFHRSCLRMNPSNSVFLSKYTCDDCDRISRKQTSKFKTESSYKLSREDISNKEKISQPFSTSTNTKIQRQQQQPLLTPTESIGSTTTLKRPQIRFTSIDPYSRIYDSSDNSLDYNKREDFTKKYLGRKGRRKGSFHLKRDLVSYRVLASQKNLALNYSLIQPEIKSKINPNLNLYRNETHNYNSDHEFNHIHQENNHQSIISEEKLNSIIEVDQVVSEIDEKINEEQEQLENMKKSRKQSLITEFLIKNKEQTSDDPSQDDETNKKSKTPRKGKNKRRRFTPKSKKKVYKVLDETSEDKANTNNQKMLHKQLQLQQKRRSRPRNISKPQTFSPPTNEQKLKLTKNYRALSPPLPLDASLEITEEDNKLFETVQQDAENRLSTIILTPLKTQSSNSTIDGENPLRCPAAIEIGNYEIETWYSSLYPHEYARLQKLFICEFCLKYMKSSDMLQRHLKKCTVKKPPGDEIYRSKQIIPNFHIKTPIYLSVYEVDGANAKWYCQNLCLLGKLFIDHKTLLFDVEHFLFYILTIDDIYGSHFVGYFSKEKFSSKRYNVSCIVTLPQFQRCGFGRFLIDFSYLLSKRENLIGTPEKPLSDLGKLSYLSYWRFKIYEYVDKRFKEFEIDGTDLNISIESISNNTGLNVNDISSTLQWCNAFKKANDEWVLEFKEEEIERCLNKPRIELSEENLIWTPLVSNELQVYEDDEVYNVLFYDDALDQNEINQIKGLQMPGKLKKKRRRRWNKAYNHNSKRRKRPAKTGDDSGNWSTIKPINYEDDDSQLVSNYENEDDTEEENNSDNSIIADVKFPNGNFEESTRMTTNCESKLPASNQQAINQSDDDCDDDENEDDDEEQEEEEEEDGDDDEFNCDNKLSLNQSIIEKTRKNRYRTPPLKIKRKRSSSRSAFKKFKQNNIASPIMMNGSSGSSNSSNSNSITKINNVKANGKINNRNVSLDDEVSSDSNISESPHHNNYESNSQRYRNLSNGILKMNSND